MRKHCRISSLILFLSSVMLITSCNDDDEFGTFPSEAGIEGRVWTQNEFGQPLYNERSGISVRIESEFRTFNASADEVGRYRLTRVPVETYTGTYSKQGYGTIVSRYLKINTASPAFEVMNGFHQFPSVTLTKLPNTSFSNISAVLQGGGTSGQPLTLNVSATMAPAPPPTGQAKGYRIFVNNGGEVSRNLFKFQKHMTSLTANFQVSLESELFSQFPNTSGSVISVIIYGDANFDQSFENASGVLVFPNLSVQPSERVSVVLP